VDQESMLLKDQMNAPKVSIEFLCDLLMNFFCFLFDAKTTDVMKANVLLPDDMKATQTLDMASSSALKAPKASKQSFQLFIYFFLIFFFYELDDPYNQTVRGARQ
jgi:hypothetical protein